MPQKTAYFVIHDAHTEAPEGECEQHTKLYTFNMTCYYDSLSAHILAGVVSGQNCNVVVTVMKSGYLQFAYEPFTIVANC